MIRTVNSTAAILLSVITVLALFLFITPLTTGKAEAESAVTDASAEVLFSSGSRKITGKYVIKKDSVLPEGATLTVDYDGTGLVLR